VTKHVSRQ